MATAVLATRLEPATKQEFESKTRRLGLTPQAAISAFIARFNEDNGFPFSLKGRPYKPFRTEDETLNWSEDMTHELWSDHETI